MVTVAEVVDPKVSVTRAEAHTVADTKGMGTAVVVELMVMETKEVSAPQETMAGTEELAVALEGKLVAT